MTRAIKAKDSSYHLAPSFAAVHEHVCDWAEEVLSRMESGDWIASYRVDNVENEARDGFFPYTSGGIEGVGYASLYTDYSSGGAPKIIQPYIDADLKAAEEEWDRQNPTHTVEWIYQDEDERQLRLSEEMRRARERVRENWREKFYEFESEWLMEGGNYFWKVYALYHAAGSSRNESGEDEVLFCVGINTDFEYGRDRVSWLFAYGSDPQCTKWHWEKTVKASEVTQELIDSLIEEAMDAGAAQF